MKKYPSAENIKVGVVGYGGAYNMGLKHLTQMREAGMTPVAVAEIDPERLKAASDDFPGIGLYPTPEEMLKASEVDLVAIITPHNTHAAIALQALRQGRHVVCEKPMAITTDECDAMIATARENGVLVTAYHNRHWDGIPRTALKLIHEANTIGDVYKIDCRRGWYGKPGDTWRSSRSISGGILYDWGVHLLEYAFQIVDSPMLEVSGFAKSGFWGTDSQWGDDHIEDEASAVVRFANGVCLNLTISQVDSDLRPGMITFTGTEGSLTFMDPHTRYVMVQWRDGQRITTEGRQLESQHGHFYQNIADTLTNQAELVITPEWARRPIHVLDLAGQSARCGHALEPVYP